MKEKTLKQTKISRGEIQEIALLIQSGASEKSIAGLFDLSADYVRFLKNSKIL